MSARCLVITFPKSRGVLHGFFSLKHEISIGVVLEGVHKWLIPWLIWLWWLTWWETGSCLKSCYKVATAQEIKNMWLPVCFMTKRPFQWQMETSLKPQTENITDKCECIVWACSYWPACSWEILTVGREEIFSFSAGGGPVFSNWPSN